MKFDYSQLPDYKVICADAKSFYATVEAVERDLDPMKAMVAVVGDVTRPGSVVLASSIMLKRRYNIRTGSRLYEIPPDRDIHIVQARMGLYLNKSMQILSIANRFAPIEAIQAYSIDEFFLSSIGCETLFGSPYDLAIALKRAVWRETRLLLACGIGPNKYIAKVVLDNYGKHQGIASAGYSDVQTMLWPLLIQNAWGIGDRMQQNLNRLGIKTIGDLAATDITVLKSKFGVIGEQLYYHSWGVDLSPVIIDPDTLQSRKSFSTGITLMRDYDKRDARIVILELVDQLTAKLRHAGVAAGSVSLSLKFSHRRSPSFHKSRKLISADNVATAFTVSLIELLERAPGIPIRHINIGMSDLVPESAIQIDLFTFTQQERLRRLSKAIDEITDTYGHTAIFRASSLTNAGTAIDRAFKIGGHYE